VKLIRGTLWPAGGKPPPCRSTLKSTLGVLGWIPMSSRRKTGPTLFWAWQGVRLWVSPMGKSAKGRMRISSSKKRGRPWPSGPYRTPQQVSEVVSLRRTRERSQGKSTRWIRIIGTRIGSVLGPVHSLPGWLERGSSGLKWGLMPSAGAPRRPSLWHPTRARPTAARKIKRQVQRRARGRGRDGTTSRYDQPARPRVPVANKDTELMRPREI